MPAERYSTLLDGSAFKINARRVYMHGIFTRRDNLKPLFRVIVHGGARGDGFRRLIDVHRGRLRGGPINLISSLCVFLGCAPGSKPTSIYGTLCRYTTPVQRAPAAEENEGRTPSAREGSDYRAPRLRGKKMAAAGAECGRIRYVS